MFRLQPNLGVNFISEVGLTISDATLLLIFRPSDYELVADGNDMGYDTLFASG